MPRFTASHARHAHLSIVALSAALLLTVACSDDPTQGKKGEDMGSADQGTTTDMRASDMNTTDMRAVDMGQVDLDMPSATPIKLAASREVNVNHLATADACSTCHSTDATTPSTPAMRDAKGRAVGFYDLWQATMMANSARDPFWRAMVAAEVKATPAAAEAIEAKCTTCHAPQGRAAAAPSALSMAELLKDTNTAQLGLDGVSCTTCHQIKPDNLGTPESFSGGFELAQSGVLYGPHANPFTRPMEMHTGFTPTQGDHMRDSALCATCHTLETTTLDATATATGHTLSEQTPYLEWQNSVYAQGGAQAASCQDCHVPRTDADGAEITTHIARRPEGGTFGPVSPRKMARHLYVGGNTLIPQILRDNAADLQPRASREAFDTLITEARAQLGQRTARLTVTGTQREGDALVTSLRVQSFTGHKLPTGFPSRRVWLRVVVKNGAGATVFASGDFDTSGRILDGATGMIHAIEQPGGPTEPHHDQIDDPARVQIYEAIMAGTDGAATWRLLRGARYLKDNRLLPLGWNPDHVAPMPIAPVGPDEANFAGGEDTIQYRINAPASAGPYTIEAQLLYQPLATRFAEELFLFGGELPEVAIFQAYWRRAARVPELISTADATAP